MADKIIGDPDCQLYDVVNAMSKEPTFSQTVDNKWKDLARSFKLREDVIFRLDKEWKKDNIDASELMLQVLASFRIKYSDNATLGALIQEFKKFELESFITQLEKKFYTAEVKSPNNPNNSLDGLGNLLKNCLGNSGTSSDLSEASLAEKVEANIFEKPVLAVSVKKRVTPATFDDKCYTYRPNDCGYALIMDFSDYQSTQYRSGAQYDTFHMTGLLSQLGYKVIRCTDQMLSTQRNVDKVLEIFKEKFKQSDVHSFMIYVGGHGKQQTIILPNGDKLDLYTDIIYKFSRQACPKSARLNEIPKIFIVQACRDFVRKDTPGYNNLDNAMIIYAACPGNFAVRNIHEGSYFVSCLVKVFMEHAHESDLQELVNKTAEDVKNVSCNVSGTQVDLGSSYEVLGSFKKFFFNV